jgi:hypothetical protein
LGGSGLNFLSRSADEELLGSFAGIASSLISFYRKTDLPVYLHIAHALEALGDGADLLMEETPPSTEHPCASLEAIMAAADRSSTSLSSPTVDELSLTAQLVRGHSIVKVPGKWNRLGDTDHDLIVLPEPRSLADFVTAPCKQEVSLMRQTRQTRQAFNLFSRMDPVR